AAAPRAVAQYAIAVQFVNGRSLEATCWERHHPQLASTKRCGQNRLVARLMQAEYGRRRAASNIEVNRKGLLLESIGLRIKSSADHLDTGDISVVSPARTDSWREKRLAGNQIVVVR